MNDNSLDSFLTTENDIKPEAAQQTGSEEKVEDEFARLLNDFIQQGNSASAPSSTKEEAETLEAFTDNSDESGLDGFITEGASSAWQGETTSAAAEDVDGLNSFISEQSPEEENKNQKESDDSEDDGCLKAEEKELARAVSNFQDGIYALADKKNFKLPETDYNENMLLPNYKPSVGKKIAQYLLACWDIVTKYDPENMKNLAQDATDEQYLAFAETLNDTDLQLSVISYVEILINLEICEVSYEQKKEILQKNRIKKELYEEYMELQERKALFIKKVKEKNFPIDADKLIGNYFRVAQKDPDGAFEALTKNPAMFSPIEFEKIHPKFFGLIKVTPEDGIKANQRIGAFIKKLKV